MTQCCQEAGAGLVVRATTAEESDLLLEARRLAGTAVMAAGPTVIEDVCVRPGQLAEMLAAVQEVSADSGIPIATVAHAGDGNLHPVLMLPDLDAETVARAMAAGERAPGDQNGARPGRHPQPWPVLLTPRKAREGCGRNATAGSGIRIIF